MLTTAARSLMTPHRAASAIGVALAIELLNIPTKLNELPFVAHIKKEAMKQKTTTVMSQPVERMPRAICQAPRKNVTAINAYRVGWTGRVRYRMGIACEVPIKFIPNG